MRTTRTTLTAGLLALAATAAAPALPAMSPVTLSAEEVAADGDTTDGDTTDTTDGDPDDEWEPNLVFERVFYKCGDAPTASNLHGPLGATIPWSTQPPSGSVTGGSGCAHADFGQTGQEPTIGAVFAGEFTGNLDELLITQDALSFGNGDNWSLTLGLTIDGEEVLPPTSIHPTALVSNGGVTTRFEISITDIGLLAREEDTTHQIELTWSYDEMDRLVVWTWDAAESPSGITFNHPVQQGVDVISITGDDVPSGDGATSDPSPSPSPSPSLPATQTAVVAGPGAVTTGYATPTMVVPQGSGLSFFNADTAAHDVTSLGRDADGEPLFQSDLIGPGAAEVRGVAGLPAGTYPFFCSIHTGMTGELTVN